MPSSVRSALADTPYLLRRGILGLGLPATRINLPQRPHGHTAYLPARRGFGKLRPVLSWNASNLPDPHEAERYANVVRELGIIRPSRDYIGEGLKTVHSRTASHANCMTAITTWG